MFNRRCSRDDTCVEKSIQQQLGLHIKRLRQKYGLTQQKLSERSHVSVTHIQNLEGKKPKNPHLDILEKLANGFGIPVWQLLKFE